MSRPRAEVKTFQTGGEWCAEVYVDGTMLEVEYGPSQKEATVALWAKVTRAHRIQTAGLNAVCNEVYRQDPLREWKALFRKLNPFRKT